MAEIRSRSRISRALEEAAVAFGAPIADRGIDTSRDGPSSGVKNARASVGSVSRAHRRVGRRVCRSVMPRERGRASKRGVSRKKLPRDKGDRQQQQQQ